MNEPNVFVRHHTRHERPRKRVLKFFLRDADNRDGRRSGEGEHDYECIVRIVFGYAQTAGMPPRGPWG